jgi:GxxExxY protein
MRSEDMDEVQIDRQARLRMVIPDEWNSLTETILACAFEVHTALGPGLIESIYEEALVHEFRLRGLSFEQQYPIRLQYKGLQLPLQKLDLVVERLVVVELKSVERVPDVHLAQLVSYLRAADVPLGLLLNFNVVHLKNAIYRRINPMATAAKNNRSPLRPSASPPSPLR